MNDTTRLWLALAAGVALGGFFFAGLWWTVRRSLLSRQPALLLTCSMLLRLGVTLAGFYLVSQGNWARLLSCLGGFVMARLIVIRLTGTQVEAAHASEP